MQTDDWWLFMTDMLMLFVLTKYPDKVQLNLLDRKNSSNLHCKINSESVDIHPKCFSCSLANYTWGKQNIVQFHCLSLYRNDLYWNDRFPRCYPMVDFQGSNGPWHTVMITRIWKFAITCTLYLCIILSG